MDLFPSPVSDQYYFRVLPAICAILEKARSRCLGWYEVDNMINVIVPTLTLLDFGQYELAAKKTRFSQPVSTSHQPDYEVRGVGRTLALLEAKPFTTPLLGRHSTVDYVTPLDQVLTYLDNYDDVFGMLTNGRHWFLLKKVQADAGGPSAGFDYIGASFDLEGGYGRMVDADNLQAFLSMCHARRLFAAHWPDAHSVAYHPREVRRTGRSSILFLRDFSQGRIFAQARPY